MASWSRWAYLCRPTISAWELLRTLAPAPAAPPAPAAARPPPSPVPDECPDSAWYWELDMVRGRPRHCGSGGEPGSVLAASLCSSSESVIGDDVLGGSIICVTSITLVHRDDQQLLKAQRCYHAGPPVHPLACCQKCLYLHAMRYGHGQTIQSQKKSRQYCAVAATYEHCAIRPIRPNVHPCSTAAYRLSIRPRQPCASPPSDTERMGRLGRANDAGTRRMDASGL